MDRRLASEFLPGVAFLAGHAYGGLLWAAAGTVVAAAVAVLLRWRWDRAMPWLALVTLALVTILTALGIILNDETFVLIRPTVGALVFAAILGVGAFFHPSLLERTLGYKLQIHHQGWPILHIAWIVVTLISALANEVARRVFSTDIWAIYNALYDPVMFGLIYHATYCVAYWYWIEQDDRFIAAQ